MATTEEMDRMYRLQRYFYDFTRKYYLLGRDRLLREMDLAPGARVLEIGCGTGSDAILMVRQASPMAWLAVAQAEQVAKFGPRKW